jgi:hypothetical protein
MAGIHSMKLSNNEQLTTITMKKILTLTALIVLFQLSACKDDNEANNHDQSVAMLTASAWGSPTVMNATDGDLSDQYSDMIMVFNKKPDSGFDGTYVIGNGLYAFPETTGKWKFNSDLTKIVFDSGREISYTLSKTNLHLDFVVAPIGGRINGLSGNFTFDLKPQ